VDTQPHRHRAAARGRGGRDHHRSCRARGAACDRGGGSDRADIDLICVGTTTPDLVFPNVGTLLQERLGIHNGCPAFSLEAACTGFMYALSVADKFVRLGESKCALVVGCRDADANRRLERSRNLRLFADGAGAVILQAVARAGNHQHAAAFRRPLQGSLDVSRRRLQGIPPGARGQGEPCR
jgi:3-oxoacyl-[acyl-carrier-protein] synthase III